MFKADSQFEAFKGARILELLRKLIALGWESAILLVKGPKAFLGESYDFVHGKFLRGRRHHAVSSPIFQLPHGKSLELRISDRPQRPHLNVVLPKMRFSEMSGGPNTVIQFGYRMASLGVPVRFLSADCPPDADQAALFEHFSHLTGTLALPPDVSIVDASSGYTPAEVGDGDIFCASAWWTAQKIQAQLHRFKRRRFFYIIQDFEPGLYPWGTEYALSLGTYSLDYFPIVNSELLRDHFAVSGIGKFKDPSFTDRAPVLRIALDRSHFYPEKDLADRLKYPSRRLLFYARPTKAKRNLFEIGLQSLKLAAERGAFKGNWELLFIGEPVGDVQLTSGVSIRQAPWMNYDTYASLLRSSDIALSMMLSPHPSYLPLEMAACGGVAVTNSFGVKTADRLARISPNILAGDPLVDNIASLLESAVSRSCDAVARVNGSVLDLPKTWDEDFERVLPQAIAEWRRLTSH